MDNEFSIEEESQPFIDWGWILSHLTGQDGILILLWQHLVLSLVPVAIALAISLPIGILVHRKRWLYPPATAITGVLYTIPSLAFFVMLIPIMGVGRPPVLVALTAYSLLILIRNVVTGLDSVPDDTKDAARGMGLTERQILLGVELPLALPVIVAGIRIATVTVIGIASIADFIGAGGLGDLIFEGIGRQFATPIIVGGVLVALIAISADVGLYRVEGWLRPWARRDGGAA
ncbi:MAG: ABC transporter permease [Actinomycetota bacterium]|nr:ABC transporter permease [Actinomycetota bacterium]